MPLFLAGQEAIILRQADGIEAHSSGSTRLQRHNAFFIVTAARFAADNDISGPIREQADAGDNHLPEGILRRIGARNVDPRVGVARE